MNTNEHPTCGYTVLAEVLNEYGFENHGKRGTKWKKHIDNDTNCQSVVFLHILNDKETVRLSIADEDGLFIDSVDMFETKDMDKIRKFMELVMF